MAKEIRKEKKAIQHHHMISLKNTSISNRCRECSLTKILSGWDEASSSESSTEGSSSSDEESDEINHTQWTREDGKIKKIIKHVTKETFYRQ